MELYEYARYDAVGLRDLISAGEVGAAEVEDTARRALAEVDPRVNGLALPVFEPALDHADDGPFAGVPFLIKDSGPMAEGVPFTLGCRGIPGIPAPHDSDLMTRIRAAGLVTLGLTTVPEMVVSYATESLRYGPTRNPWDLGRGVGGSSGGAAALVAAGAVPLAHANDGAGSIRVPASCCGLVGLKPSRGRTPCGPDTGEIAFGMTKEFGLTRTVRDAAHYLDVLQGPGVGDKYTAPPPDRPYADELGAETKTLRVAVTTRSWSGSAVDEEVARTAVRTGRVLEEMGHTVSEAGPAIDWDTVRRATRIAPLGVVAPLLLAGTRLDPAGLEAVSRRIIDDAKAFSALGLLAGLDAQNQVTRTLGTFFTEYDLLVTPTIGRLPAPHGTLRYDDPRHTVESWLAAIFDYGPFTVVFNVSGHPAISLPLGHSESGLPIGVQLVAAYGREDLLFRVAARLEEALPWKDRTPGVFAG